MDKSGGKLGTLVCCASTKGGGGERGKMSLVPIEESMTSAGRACVVQNLSKKESHFTKRGGLTKKTREGRRKLGERREGGFLRVKKKRSSH